VLDNNLYDVEIHNNLPSDQAMIFSRATYCDFCGENHKDNCVFAFQDNVTLESILSLMKYERELELTINWKSNAKVNLKQIENPQFMKTNLNAPNSNSDEIKNRDANQEWMANSKNISIYDCLSCFGQEETLTGSEMWYCSKCKDHVPALKKMEVYKTPEYLIIHFKRFSK
jgi:ribosomal protein L37AE/L43A